MTRAQAGVIFDEASRTWLITMARTSYAFGLSAEGSLRHLHWGAPIDPATVAGLATADRPRLEHERDLAWSHDAPDEYVAWGGMRYDEPTLKAEYADGVRSVELMYRRHRVIRKGGHVRLEIDLVDGDRLSVTLCYRAYDGFDVLERWVRLQAGTAGEVALRLAYSANWWLPAREGDWRWRYLHGGWATESRQASVVLRAPGKFTLESRRGTTSHQFSPWFAVDPDSSATEEHGEVWSGQIAWSGSWKLVAERTAGGRLHMTGGWNDFDLSYVLRENEQVTLPAFAALHTDAGFGGASREWHGWIRTCVLGRGDTTGTTHPRREVRVREPERPEPERIVASRPWRPVLYNSWEATSFEVSEDGQRALAARAARIGVELFVVDDGWFAGRTSSRAGLGDWTPDPVKFPRGLDPLIDYVEGHGMGFGLWVEPEMVNRDSDLFRSHPDWVYHFTGREPAERRDQLMLNLARPDVAEWVYTTLDDLLTRYDIAFLKWDANRNVADPGWPGAVNPERLWIDHTTHLYGILQALRTAHPRVAIEGCAGGGGRVDLGILAHVDEVWPSDNTEPTMRWPIQEGFSQAFPPAAMASWVTDSKNPALDRPLPLSYRFHVAMAGVMGIGGDLTRWTDAELDEAAGHVARYQQIRPVVQGGLLYRHGDTWEYVAPDGSEAVVISAWTDRALDGFRSRVRLSGLDPSARYRDDVSGEEYGGDRLAWDGLPLPDRESSFGYGSSLVRLVRVRA